jgi:hypothetical protein
LVTKTPAEMDILTTRANKTTGHKCTPVTGSLHPDDHKFFMNPHNTVPSTHSSFQLFPNGLPSPPSYSHHLDAYFSQQYHHPTGLMTGIKGKPFTQRHP